MTFKKQIALEVINEFTANKVNWTIEEALAAIKAISKQGIGKATEGSSNYVIKVDGNKVAMGLVEYTFCDGLVLDRQGKAFRGMMLADAHLERGRCIVDQVHKLDAVSAFMFVFIHALKRVVNGSKDRVVDNLGLNIEKAVQDCGFSTQTSDTFEYLDGGSKHVLLHSFVPVTRIDGDIHKSSADELQEIIPMAYYRHGDGHSFKKNVFHSGSFLHIRGNQLSPQVRAEIVNYMLSLGADVQLDEDDVILLSSKEAKGPARLTLPFAQVAYVIGGLLSGWKLNDQLEQMRGHIVPCGFFPTLAFAPGHSLWMGDIERLPQAVIPHTYRGFEVEASECSADSVTDLPGVYEVSKEGNWFTATFQDTWVTCGDVIGKCGHALVTIDASIEGSLKWVRWQLSQTLGGEKRISIEWCIETVERTYKGRSIAKAQPIKVSSKFVYNELNQGLAAMDLIHAQDGIKSDVVYSWLMPIATTAIHTQDEQLLALIEAINLKVEGRAHREYLCIDPVWVMRGAYEQLQRTFEANYGRSVWFNFQACGDLGRMMYEMYINNIPKGWQLVEVPASVEQMVSANKPNARCLVAVADGDVNDDKTNVLVFVVNRKGAVIRYFQRAYGFVGCRNLEGFEVATVTTAVSSSQQMATYIRSLKRLSSSPEAWDAECNAMMGEGHRKRLLVKAMHAMNTGVVYEGAQVYDLRYSEHVVALQQHLSLYGVDYSLASNRCDLFTRLAGALSGHYLRLSDNLTLWLPALYQLTSVETDSDAGMSVPALVRALLIKLLNGLMQPNSAEFNLMVRRIKGMLEVLLNHESNHKLQGGRTNAMAKRIALPCVPTSEVWVLSSAKVRSVHRKLQALNKHCAINNMTVAGNRAPMCDGHVAKVRLISPEHNSKLFWQLSEEQFAISPMANNSDGGDFDGDGEGLTRVDAEVPVSTFESIRAARSATLGVDMFDAKCTGYARDHYGIKQWGKVQLRPVAKSFMSAQRYVKLMQGAAAVQQQMVGAAYTVCNMIEASADVIAGLGSLGVDLPKHLSWAVVEGGATTARAYELYEVALGGFSKSTYKVWTDWVCPMSNSKELVQIDSFEKFDRFLADVVAMGSNERPDAKETFRDSAMSLAGGFNTAAMFVYVAKQVKGERVPQSVLQLIKSRYCIENDALAECIAFIACTVYAVYESSRGNQVGFSWVDGCNGTPDEKPKCQVMDFVVRYYAEHAGEAWFEQWVNSSLVLTHWFKHVLRDIATVALPQFQHLCWLDTAELEVFTAPLAQLASAVVVDGVEVDLTPEALQVLEVSAAPAECTDWSDWSEDAPVSAAAEYEESETLSLWDMLNAAEVAPAEETVVAAEPELPAEEPAAAVDPADYHSLVAVAKSDAPAEGYVVALFSAMAKDGAMLPCNNNFPVGLTGGFAADVRPNGPNYTAFGVTKTGTTTGYNESPVGFMACQIRYQAPAQAVAWAPMVAGFGVQLPQAEFVSIIVDQGDLALTDELELGKAHVKRDLLRDAFLLGESDTVGSYAVESHQSVMNLLADGERHFFAIVGKVSGTALITNGRGQQQAQVRVSSCAIAHLNKEACFDAQTGLVPAARSEALLQQYAGLL